MLFDKKEEEKESEDRMERYRKALNEKFHKFVFFTGLAIAFKGLKGWLRSKKRKITG